MKLYQSSSSPNSRRVRIFIAEKGISVPVVQVDLGSKEQFSDSYKVINPRLVVPTLLLDDGTSIGEVPVIQRYLDDVNPDVPLFGADARERALVAMWDRRAEQEGFASAMEAVRNAVAGLKGRAIAGPHDYEQIPALIERSKQRISNFYSDLESRLAMVPFVAGEKYSVADITALVAVDFATKGANVPVPEGFPSLMRWYQTISSRPSAKA